MAAIPEQMVLMVNPGLSPNKMPKLAIRWHTQAKFLNSATRGVPETNLQVWPPGGALRTNCFNRPSGDSPQLDAQISHQRALPSQGAKFSCQGSSRRVISRKIVQTCHQGALSLNDTQISHRGCSKTKWRKSATRRLQGQVD